jgi:nitroreductase
MNVYEAITTRRSVPQTTGRPEREAVMRLLGAAVRAPNHHLTQPWRFVVLTGSALDELADAWTAGVARTGERSEGIFDKCHRAPVIICVIERPKTHLPKVVEIEEHHATGAAIQNILLAAHGMGLGAMIRTGPAATLDEVHAYLGVQKDELIAGFVYLGHPPEGDDQRPMSRRTDPAELTEWRGWK